MSAVYRNPTPPQIPWVSDSAFDFWSTRVHPLWTWRRPLARLLARTPASADAVTLELQPNRHFAGVLPGQHVTLGVEIDGRVVSRSYSPTLLGNGRLAITIKRIEGGVVSRYLIDHLAIGQVVDISAAFGDMTVPAQAGQPLLMLAAGSGITPMRSLLTQLDGLGMPVPVHLVYWARRREQLCFADELAALAQRHANFRVTFALTGDGAPRIDAFDISSVGALEGTRVLACGPAGFVDSARRRLSASAAAFQSEAFSVPALPDIEQGSVQVELLHSGKTLTVARGTSLLVALEEAGVNPASGCRMGICNTCVCGKASGVTRHTLTGEYAAESSIPLKLCVNSASTDLVLEL